MRREIDELFGDVFERTGLTQSRTFTPEVDVYYCGKPARAIVKVAIPGIDPDDVSLEIRGRQLVIAGVRRAQEAEGRLYQQIEIAHGPFKRVIELSAEVAAERRFYKQMEPAHGTLMRLSDRTAEFSTAPPAATYDDGVLWIDIPLAQP